METADSIPKAEGDKDNELELLLNKAKESLARKEAERKEKEDSTGGAKGITALSIPLKLDSRDTSDGLYIKIQHKTGLAKLDTSKLYNNAEIRHSGTNGSSVSVLAKSTKSDPTVRRKSAREATQEREKTVGPKWFGMKAPVLTPELKNNIRVLQLRNVLDPKKFYKKGAVGKEIPKYFEMGTVIEGATEFYSSRLTRKERKRDLVDELLSDKKARDYFKRKVREVHLKNSNPGKRKAQQQQEARKRGRK